MNGIYKLRTCVHRLLTILMAGTLSLQLSAQSGVTLNANFSQDKTRGCLPLIIQFTDNSTGTGLSHVWDFGNGNTSALKNPGAIYTQAGNYTVKLIVTDKNGAKDTVIKHLAVQAFANPNVAFEANTTNGCTGQEFSFTDTAIHSSAPITSYLWNFGDGSQSTEKNPKHAFLSEGKFSVSLIITDSNGCKNFLNKAAYIKTTLPAKVAFTSNSKGGCTAPLHVAFKNNTPQQAGLNYNYLWKFGNGDSSVAENPSITYHNKGNYDVSLTITDDNQCTTTLLSPTHISIGATKANFTLENKKGCLPHTVYLKNTGTGIPANATVKWLFGNGDSATGADTSYTYTTVGTFSITLVITSPEGCNDTLVKTDSVVTLASPTAHFAHTNPLSCNVPHTISFSSANTAANSWLWDFGDGTTSTLKNPVKRYDSAGVFNVKLVITDANGCKGSSEKMRLARIKPLTATFSPPVKQGCAPLTTTFTNNSSAYYGIKKHTWDLGNGITSNANNITTTYTTEGIYYPRLIVEENSGCIDTFVFDAIKVGKKTNPDFKANKVSGCRKEMGAVKFTNLTNITNQHVDSFVWNFGGFTSKETHPFADFKANPGQHTVTLISISNGCADTITKQSYITVKAPIAGFSITEDPCLFDTTVFKNASYGGHIFDWYVDGILVNKTKSFKQYLQPGKHYLDLMVKDTATGCSDTKAHVFIINKPLTPGFTKSADSLCANNQVLLTDTTTGADSSFWKIGDQPTVKGKLITPEFALPGVQHITLTVHGAYGCKYTTSQPKAIKVLGPDYTPIITPNHGCFPLDAQLIKIGKSEHGVASATWSDNYNTINSLADTLPFTFKTAMPKMNTNGIAVYLTVKDNLGCTVIKTAHIKMSQPVAKVLPNKTLNCDNTVVEFAHDSAASMHSGKLSYNWVYNDRTVYSVNRFSQQYFQNSVAKITLTVTEQGLGCSDSATTFIPVVVKKITAGFIADKTATTCPPLVSGFSDASIAENTTITASKWWFGDGATSVLPAPSKTYFYPGQYTISYKVTDAQGCSDSVTEPAKIKIGGPTGTYTIDRYNGCVPFTANFTATSQNAKTVNWDLGNGQLSNGASASGSFTLAGTYKPSLVLEDTFGCLVVYPVKNPIVGLAAPTPDFIFSGKCAHENFTFTNTTDTTQLPVNFEWVFTEKETYNSFNAERTFTNTGKHNVQLKAIATNGCIATKNHTVEIMQLNADFQISNTQICSNSALTTTDNSQAQAGIKNREWIWGDGQTDTAQNVAHTYTNPGNYNVSLVIEDNNGCFDTTSAPKNIIVFDTLTPKAPFVYRVTVQQNNSVKLEFAPYNNINFSAYQIYRSTLGEPEQLYTTITNITDTTFTDDKVNTLSQSYTYKIYTLTACGKLSQSSSHTTVLLQTVADTNVVTVSWSAYQGWDSVRDYQIFRKEANETVYKKIETVPAFITTYTDTKAYCGNTYTYIVYAQKFTGELLSSSNYTSATPIYIEDVYPAKIVRATVEDDKSILVEFAPNYLQKTPVEYYMIEKSADGKNFTQVFKAPVGVWSFTDETVNVHNQSYFYRTRTTDICNAVSAPGNIGKTILLHAKADDNDNVNLQWNNYQQWNEGISHYEVEQMNSSSNFITVATNNPTDTLFTDNTNLFNHLPRIAYRVKAISNEGVVSYSNIADANGRSSLFVPSAFTPNSDEHNNIFKVVGAYIKAFEINIYNRYGEKIFTGNSLDESWDGSYKGEPVQEGAYVYVINALGIDTKHHNLSGTITVLR
ncbi:MAG: PKD domain-containing protein [Bacteroidota bacterium]